MGMGDGWSVRKKFKKQENGMEELSYELLESFRIDTSMIRVCKIKNYCVIL